MVPYTLFLPPSFAQLCSGLRGFEGLLPGGHTAGVPHPDHSVVPADLREAGLEGLATPRLRRPQLIRASVHLEKHGERIYKTLYRVYKTLFHLV